MSKKNYKDLKRNCEDVASILKTIAHPQRLTILCLLIQEEMCASEILEETEISQSQLSQFLNKMQKENILSSRREGNFVYFRLTDSKVKKAA